ncbi:hypothetical protein [Massilia sp. TS11]|uniref:hypothetical protein n=1 Tax=Massilia sp. TS11 TaxID=2908003 RepID=UPI001EDC0341|nr:hypothetical protein [Massilia sp. TS11]MCG2585524.1 hypothetical protein [Massilia sp. TS11]
MNWLRESISDGRTGRASSKRVAMLLATLALALAVVILAAAAVFGRDVAAAIAAVAVPLAGIGGGAYVGGKSAERRRDEDGGANG